MIDRIRKLVISSAFWAGWEARAAIKRFGSVESEEELYEAALADYLREVFCAAPREAERG